jgi:hypothetical protein
MPGVLESLTVGDLLDSKPTQGPDARVMTVSSTQVRMRPSAARRRVVAPYGMFPSLPLPDDR